MERRRYRLAVRNRPDAIALVVIALCLGGTLFTLGLVLLAAFALVAAALAGGTALYGRLRTRRTAHASRRQCDELDPGGEVSPRAGGSRRLPGDSQDRAGVHR
jgi:hypothetical protein